MYRTMERCSSIREIVYERTVMNEKWFTLKAFDATANMRV